MLQTQQPGQWSCASKFDTVTYVTYIMLLVQHNVAGLNLVFLKPNQTKPKQTHIMSYELMKS